MRTTQRVTKPDRARAEACREEIARRIQARSKGDGEREVTPGLFLYRSSVPAGPLYGVTEPSLCVVVQGCKEIFLGGERYRYDADRYLLISAGVPVVGRTHRIARAIEHLRAHQGKPLGIEGVARQFGMSVSAFHHQFKAVTAMSPLQFQKQIRLQEARRLLLAGMADAAGAGYQVGYDDPAHFNREYKRMFGAPPMRDVERLRGTASSG